MGGTPLCSMQQQQQPPPQRQSIRTASSSTADDNDNAVINNNNVIDDHDYDDGNKGSNEQPPPPRSELSSFAESTSLLLLLQSTRKRYAYAFYATGEEYACGALVNIQALRDSGSGVGLTSSSSSGGGRTSSSDYNAGSGHFNGTTTTTSRTTTLDFIIVTYGFDTTALEQQALTMNVIIKKVNHLKTFQGANHYYHGESTCLTISWSIIYTSIDSYCDILHSTTTTLTRTFLSLSLTPYQTSNIHIIISPDVMVKLRIFQLFEYDRIVFMDSDMLVKKNLDHLFLLPESSHIAAPRVYFEPEEEDSTMPNNHPKFCSCLMVVTPTKHMWKRIMTYYDNGGGSDGDDEEEEEEHGYVNERELYDMDLLNKEFGGEVTFLPGLYELLTSHLESASEWDRGLSIRPHMDRKLGMPNKTWYEIYDAASIVHFTGLKPYLDRTMEEIQRKKRNADPRFFAIYERYFTLASKVCSFGYSYEASDRYSQYLQSNSSSSGL